MHRLVHLAGEKSLSHALLRLLFTMIVYLPQGVIDQIKIGTVEDMQWWYGKKPFEAALLHAPEWAAKCCWQPRKSLAQSDYPAFCVPFERERGGTSSRCQPH